METKNQIKNYGFQEPKITKNHYIEGDGRLLGAVNLKPDGDWRKIDVMDEHQAKKFETWGCVPFGATQQMVKMLYYIYGEKKDYSERFLYNLVGINPPGTDPQKVYEAIRKIGLIEQKDLPMTDTLEEFKTPRPMSDILKDKAKEFFKNIYFFDHDWIINPTPEKLKTNLKKCPLCVSVTAWYLEDGVYVDKGQKNTHWTGLDYVDDEYLYIDDSYPPYKKKLPLSHKISYAKRIVLYKKDPKVINSFFLKILQGVLKLLYDFKQYTKNSAKVVGEILSGIFSKRS